MGNVKVKLDKHFYSYWARYGFSRAVNYAIGKEGIKRGFYRKFKKKVQNAVSKGKDSFSVPANWVYHSQKSTKKKKKRRRTSTSIFSIF